MIPHLPAVGDSREKSRPAALRTRPRAFRVKGKRPAWRRAPTALRQKGTARFRAPEGDGMDRKKEETGSAAGPVCGIILAAGFSTRMGRFKPMLPFGGKSVLAHVIETWHRAGVRHVVVVGGFKKELTGRCARACGVLFAENPRPEDGMFSSVAAGLACALNAFPQAGWFGVQPVDIPLILPATISAAVRAAETSEAGYVIPVCGGFRGHPPFLSRAAAKAALTMNPERGLQSVLGELSCGEVPVDDPYINMDMDRPADYDRALAILRKREKDSARREQNRKEK